jgi:hypothetical protein
MVQKKECKFINVTRIENLVKICQITNSISVHIFVIIIIIIVTTFMHGIYNYISETNNFSTVYNVAAVLYLQSLLHVTLFRP